MLVYGLRKILENKKRATANGSSIFTVRNIIAYDRKKLENDPVRNWSWVVYPESAPENWRTLLDETGENGLRVRCMIKILTKQQTNRKRHIGI